MTIPERVNFYADLAAARHGCTRADVLGRRRLHKEARWEVMRRLTAAGYTCTRIGRALGYDHTTILHGLGRLNK